MIDVFLRTNTPFANVAAALAGFDCNRVMVRNGGPTEVWQRTPAGWEKERPGMVLYDDLVSSCIDFNAFRSEYAASVLVADGMMLRLSDGEAIEWLKMMEAHRYAIEDAIGCTVNVEHAGRSFVCAAAILAISDFKSMTSPITPLAQKLVAWVDQIHAAGADQVGISIAVRENYIA